MLQIFDLALDLGLEVHAAASRVDLADWTDVCGGCCQIIVRWVVILSASSVTFRCLIVQYMLIPSIYWAAAALLRLIFSPWAGTCIKAIAS